jgi:hypothetical protein
MAVYRAGWVHRVAPSFNAPGPDVIRTPKKKAGYLPAFFSFLAARFSFSVFSGFFFSVFFWSMPLLMAVSWLGEGWGEADREPWRDPDYAPRVAAGKSGARAVYNGACH